MIANEYSYELVRYMLADDGQARWRRSSPRLQADDVEACRQWVDEQMNAMTLKQKVGQLFIHTVAPLTTQANRKNIEQAVTEYGMGGLLFSGGDIQKQIELTNYAQGLA